MLGRKCKMIHMKLSPEQIIVRCIKKRVGDRFQAAQCPENLILLFCTRDLSARYTIIISIEITK